MGIQIARGTVSEAWDEALPLVVANHAESGALPAADFGPQKETYDALEKAGIVKVFTAREAAVLVGYAVFIVSPSHLHYPKTSWAIQDVMYVAPEKRFTFPLRFMLYQDSSLRDDGVDLVYRHNTLHKDYSRLLLHLGYRAEEVRYYRDLRGEA